MDRRDRKRRSSPAEAEAEATDTEVAEDDEMPELDTSASTSNDADDFPPVFRSPKISQPELFSKPVQAVPNGRTVKGLPGKKGRGFGKTVSAPVGGLGNWSGAGSGAGMDVDRGMEDGFDVKEWAASEEF